MTSSSIDPGPKHYVQLLDLYPDILLTILKEYVPFEDKLRTLWGMPEFRPYLEDCAAWMTSMSNISVPFLDWIRTLKPGWYIHTDNWSHRFLIRLDPHAMTFSLHHFFLDSGLQVTQSPAHTDTCRNTLDRIQELFKAFLDDYVFISDIDLCIYHLKPYGLLMVQYDWDWHDRSKMRFYDWEECILDFYTPQIMKDESGEKHFKVLLGCQRTLTVECLLPTGQCLCENRITNLLPVSWQADEEGRLLKGIDGAQIPMAACETFQWEVEYESVKSDMNYHLKTPYPDIQVESRGSFNESLGFEMWSSV